MNDIEIVEFLNKIFEEAMTETHIGKFIKEDYMMFPYDAWKKLDTEQLKALYKNYIGRNRVIYTTKMKNVSYHLTENGTFERLVDLTNKDLSCGWKQYLCGIINKIVLIRTSQLELFSHLSLNEFYDECKARNLKIWEM